MKPVLHRVVAIAWLWCVVPVCAQTMAPAASVAVQAPASAEQQADAVRRALLEKTLQGPVKVMSHAWIDEQGRLHENTQFNSGMKVRGVRVNAYLHGEEGPVAHIDVQSEEADTHGKLQSCREHAVGWRRPTLVRTAVGQGFVAPEQSMAHALLADLSSDLQRWRTEAWTPTQSVWRASSRYESLLVGAAPAPAQWVLELGLSPVRQRAATQAPTASVRTALEGWGVLPSQEPWLMRLDLRWMDVQDSRRQRQWSVDVVVRPEGPVLVAGQAMALMREALQRPLKQWLNELEDALACEPVVAAVTGSGDGLALSLGKDSGIQAGDRVLLMDRSQVPERVLEPRALQGMGMAQVVAVDHGQARLQWLTGARPQGNGVNNWVAVPVQVLPRL